MVIRNNTQASSTDVADNESDIAALKVDVDLNTADRANAETIWDKDVAEVVESVGDVPSVQLIDNGNFKSDVSGWTVGNSATVTWQAGGTARIAYNGVADPFISQGILEIGEKYVFTGRARGDGTNIPNLKAGDLAWTATDATEWQDFIINFTATSATLSLNSGGATSGYVEWNYQYCRKLDTVPFNQSVPMWVSRENLYNYPLDISNIAWGKAGCTVDASPGVYSPYVDPTLGRIEYCGIVADVGAGSHYMSKAIIASGDTVSFSCIAKPGNYDFFVVDNITVSGKRFYSNLNTLDIGTLPAGVTVQMSRLWGGSVLIRATFPSVVGSNNIAFGPVTSITGGNVTGDGSTINTYATMMHLYNGSMESNIGFYNGGATLYPLKVSQEYAYDCQVKNMNGQALTADGAWEFLNNIDGFPMEESTYNAKAMIEFGLRKRYDNNTWELPHDNIKYYSGEKIGSNNVYYMQVSGTLAAASTASALTGTDVVEAVSQGGYGTSDDGTKQYPMGSTNIYATPILSTTAWDIEATADLYGSSNPYFLWVKYI